MDTGEDFSALRSGDLGELAALVQSIGRAELGLVRETRGARLMDLAELWARDALVTDLRENTLAQYRGSLDLLARFGIQVVSDVTALNVRAFMRARVQAGRSPETANRNLAALSSLFTWLHAEGRVPLIQALELRELYFDRPHMPPPEFLLVPRYCELRQVAREIDSRRFELAVGFAVEAGLRFHELRQLHREDLELELAEPFVRVSLTGGRRNKTDRGRPVPIRAAFAAELLERELPPGPIFPARAREGEVLRSPYVHRGTLREWRERSIERLGWHWTWLTLRHTFASYHAQAGRTLLEIATWLGCGEDVAKRHYASLMPGGNKVVEVSFERVPSFVRRAA